MTVNDGRLVGISGQHASEQQDWAQQQISRWHVGQAEESWRANAVCVFSVVPMQSQSQVGA
jgi:hypothetical protein